MSVLAVVCLHETAGEMFSAAAVRCGSVEAEASFLSLSCSQHEQFARSNKGDLGQGRRQRGVAGPGNCTLSLELYPLLVTVSSPGNYPRTGTVISSSLLPTLPRHKCPCAQSVYID